MSEQLCSEVCPVKLRNFHEAVIRDDFSKI